MFNNAQVRGGDVWPAPALDVMHAAGPRQHFMDSRAIGHETNSNGTYTNTKLKTDDIKPMLGWFGVYAGDDFYPSVYNESVNETAWDTFKFGRATIVNAASGSTGPVAGWDGWKPAGSEGHNGRMTLQQNIETHCARSNSIYGLVLSAQPVNNPNDTSMWVPLPAGTGGMIQAAARWSYLSRHGCPQVSGMIFDDFVSHFLSCPSVLV